MPAIEIAGKPIHVNEEGFLTEYTEWDEGIATVLAGQIGIEMDEMTTTMSEPSMFRTLIRKLKKVANWQLFVPRETLIWPSPD